MAKRTLFSSILLILIFAVDLSESRTGNKIVFIFCRQQIGGKIQTTYRLKVTNWTFLPIPSFVGKILNILIFPVIKRSAFTMVDYNINLRFVDTKTEIGAFSK